MTEKVKEYAGWVYTMLQTPLKKRKEWVKTAMNTLRSGVHDTKNNPKASENLAELLSDKSKFDLVGFSANLHYIKHDLRKGDVDEDLCSVFVHAWASPKLLYKHKTLPVVMIVGEDLRLDDSVVNEVKSNVRHDVRGFTG